jgi:hypothetical protein
VTLPGTLEASQFQTGELITKVVSPLSPNAHNLNLSADGKLAFMSPNGKVMGVAVYGQYPPVCVAKWRERNGKFKTLEDPKKVLGVSAAKLDAQRERITF